MMHDPNATYRMVRDNARRVAEERARLRRAAATSSAHSRSALMARFLRSLADRVDQSGEARGRLV